MCELVATTVCGRFAEDNIVSAHLVGFHDVLSTAIPNQIDHTEAIGEVSHQEFVALARVDFLVTENLSLDLHVRHLGSQLADVIDLCAIDILVWVVFQQVTIGVDAELLAQYLFLLRSYAWQELDVLV